ncbi:Hypothetical protein, putative [Bodo saltans]|uniref:Membrane-associated protein n=1 Tax=Bodo saltans TaxID=75058 RepID=A0A0S4JB33_BODSA|nr:Hypothetical protein, putative [Bodo saltans]|eukprot:CUG87278.1 Hypothetical protein, putative [Bodo saltans]
MRWVMWRRRVPQVYLLVVVVALRRSQKKMTPPNKKKMTGFLKLSFRCSHSWCGVWHSISAAV